ncbi:MAG: recombination protein NinG [Burkholderiaceae bacterium]
MSLEATRCRWSGMTGRGMWSGRLMATKPKTCRICKDKFTPVRALQPVCGKFACGMEYGLQVIAKAKAAKARNDGKAHREALAAAKPRGWFLKAAQVAFNKYIRIRDAAKPCVSCDRNHVEMTTGGCWDSGHYLSVGSHPELRFDENNAAKQCKSCNGGAGKYAKKNFTVTQEYRVNLIDRIGLEAVEALEGPHEAKHYSIDDLKQIKADYTRMAKELENA